MAGTLVLVFASFAQSAIAMEPIAGSLGARSVVLHDVEQSAESFAIEFRFSPPLTAVPTPLPGLKFDIQGSSIGSVDADLETRRDRLRWSVHDEFGRRYRQVALTTRGNEREQHDFVTFAPAPVNASRLFFEVTDPDGEGFEFTVLWPPK